MSGKEDKDAQEVVDIINRFYQEDKKHKVGVKGWTVEDHLVYRQSYAPDILQDLLGKLEEISSRKCSCVTIVTLMTLVTLF